MDIITAGDRVRCLDSRDSKGALQSGKIYDVLWARRFPDSVILEGVEGDWLASRFELAEEEEEDDGLSIADRIHLEVTGHLPEDF